MQDRKANNTPTRKRKLARSDRPNEAVRKFSPGKQRPCLELTTLSRERVSVANITTVAAAAAAAKLSNWWRRPAAIRKLLARPWTRRTEESN